MNALTSFDRYSPSKEGKNRIAFMDALEEMNDNEFIMYVEILIADISDMFVRMGMRTERAQKYATEFVGKLIYNTRW